MKYNSPIKFKTEERDRCQRAKTLEDQEALFGSLLIYIKLPFWKMEDSEFGSANRVWMDLALYRESYGKVSKLCIPCRFSTSYFSFPTQSIDELNLPSPSRLHRLRINYRSLINYLIYRIEIPYLVQPIPVLPDNAINKVQSNPKANTTTGSGRWIYRSSPNNVRNDKQADRGIEDSTI